MEKMFEEKKCEKFSSLMSSSVLSKQNEIKEINLKQESPKADSHEQSIFKPMKIKNSSQKEIIFPRIIYDENYLKASSKVLENQIMSWIKSEEVLSIIWSMLQGLTEKF